MSKLLIVDDSADLLEALQFILQHLGYSLQTLTDAKYIYSLIATFEPDLLILDIHLPWIDGREICKDLKTNLSTKHIPILLFSATPKDLIDYKNYYADDFMEKPFDVRTLAEKIKVLLTASSAAQLI